MSVEIEEEFTVGESTILSAFKYAIERPTEVVSEVVRDVSDNAGLLSSIARRIIVATINKKDASGSLGAKPDRAMWINLLDKLNEIEDRQ